MTAMDPQLLTLLIELELRLQTRSTRTGERPLEDLLSGDFAEIGASGRAWQRQDVVAWLSTASTREIRSERFQGRLVTSALVLLTYETIEAERRALRSSLWRLEGERWRMLFHQGTVVPS